MKKLMLSVAICSLTFLAGCEKSSSNQPFSLQSKKSKFTVAKSQDDLKQKIESNVYGKFPKSSGFNVTKIDYYTVGQFTFSLVEYKTNCNEISNVCITNAPLYELYGKNEYINLSGLVSTLQRPSLTYTTGSGTYVFECFGPNCCQIETTLGANFVLVAFACGCNGTVDMDSGCYFKAKKLETLIPAE
jgi:hypothetical protein